MFGRDLQKLLSGRGQEGQKDTNPLEIIGLSPAILELGLTNEQLYEHCRRIARDLMARVHPDRHGGVVSPQVARFSKALNRINNQAAFDAALAEFRHSRSYERAEMRLLKEQAERLQGELNATQSRIASLQGEVVHQGRFREWVSRYLVGNTVLQRGGIISLLELNFLFASPPPKNAAEIQAKVLKEYEYLMSINNGRMPRRQKAPMRAKAEEARISVIPLSKFFQMAADAKVLPVEWNFHLAVRALGMPKIPSSPPKREKVVPVRLSASSQEVLGILGEALGDRYVESATLIPRKLKIEFLDRSIAGSVDLKRALSFLDLKERAYRKLALSEEIIPEIEPIFTPGRALISVPALRPFSGVPSEKAIAKFMEERKRAVHLPHLFLSHIILGTNPAQA